MFSLVPHVPLSLFSVLECDVYVQLKKGNEIIEHISAAQIKSNLTIGGKSLKKKKANAARASHPFLKTSHNPLFRKKRKVIILYFY